MSSDMNPDISPDMSSDMSAEEPKSITRANTAVRFRRRVTVAVVTGFALSGLVGCGVPVDPDDRPISRGNIPADLLLPIATTTTTSTTSTTSPPVSTIAIRIPEYRVTLYFLDQFRLIPILRPLPEKPTAEILLAYLSLGPRDVDGVGLTTALTDNTLVRSTRLSKGQIEVELGPEFDSLTGAQQAQLFMQLIATLTELSGVGGVIFTRDGQPISVLRPDFELARGPQTKDDVKPYIFDPNQIVPLDIPVTTALADTELRGVNRDTTTTTTSASTTTSSPTP
jgi:hypothetical protein